MTETDDLYAEQRPILLAHPVLPAGVSVELPAVLAELARLGDELAGLLAATYPERPSAYDVAGAHRRRAHLLTHLAEVYPEYEQAARSAVEYWQTAEGQRSAETLQQVLAERGAPHSR